MKKVFAIFAIAGMMAACNNDSASTSATADSTRIADSLKHITDSTAAAIKVSSDTSAANKMINDVKDSVTKGMNAIKDTATKAVNKMVKDVKAKM